MNFEYLSFGRDLLIALHNEKNVNLLWHNTWFSEAIVIVFWMFFWKKLKIWNFWEKLWCIVFSLAKLLLLIIL